MSLDQATEFVKHHSPSRDAFLGGRLIVSQPKAGFRAGLDSVLLGAAVALGRRSLLDLGAGVGTAGLVALAHDPELSATLLERDPDMAALAAVNLAENGFAGRARVLNLDLTAPGAERRAAGLLTDAYDIVIANPPFFADGRGTPSPADTRLAARHMPEAALDVWLRTAAASAAPGAEVIFIHRAQSLAPLLAAFTSRFGAVTVLPLAPRAGAPASRILVRGSKGSRAPLTLLPARVLHGADGRFSPEFEAIFRGEARLHWQSPPHPPTSSG